MKVRYAEAEVAVCRGISYPERPFERVAGSLVIPLLDLLHACFDEARIGVLLRGLRVHDRDWGEQYDREAKRYDNIFFHDYFPQRYSLTLAPCPLPPVLFLHPLHIYPAFTRAVELAEEDRLPGAEHQPSVFHHHGLGYPDDARFYMGRRVAFGVAVVVFKGDHLAQFFQNVASHIRIGIFVDRYRRGRMGHVEVTHAGADSALRYQPLYALRDIDQLCPRLRLYP